MILPRVLDGPNRRAILATGLLAATVLVMIAVAWAEWTSIAERTATIERRQADLQALAVRVRMRVPGLARAERTLAADPFLPGATPTLAANGLQRRVVALAEACGVRLRTIGAETVTEPDPDRPPHVELAASATAHIAALQTLLYRLETETPFVLVDEVSVRAPQAATEEAAGTTPDPELEVDLRLLGFLRGKEG